MGGSYSLPSQGASHDRRPPGQKGGELAFRVRPAARGASRAAAELRPGLLRADILPKQRSRGICHRHHGRSGSGLPRVAEFLARDVTGRSRALASGFVPESGHAAGRGLAELRRVGQAGRLRATVRTLDRLRVGRGERAGGLWVGIRELAAFDNDDKGTPLGGRAAAGTGGGGGRDATCRLLPDPDLGGHQCDAGPVLDRTRGVGPQVQHPHLRPGAPAQGVTAPFIASCVVQ